MAKIYDMETKNKSFIRVYEQLKSQGIKNCDFFLELRNKKLVGKDPYASDLKMEDVEMIRKEARLNMWYFLRECCMVHMNIGPNESSEQFMLNQALLAMAWLAKNNYSYVAELPRQMQKTTGSLFILQWFYVCGDGKKQFEVVGSTVSKREELCDMHIYKTQVPGYLAFVPNPQDRVMHPMWYETSETYINDITGETKVKRMYIDDFYYFTNNKTAYNKWSKAPITKRPILMITGNPPYWKKETEYIKFARELSTEKAVLWKNEWYDDASELEELKKKNKNLIVKVRFDFVDLITDDKVLERYEDVMKKALNYNADPTCYNREVLLKWD